MRSVHIFAAFPFVVLLCGGSFAPAARADILYEVPTVFGAVDTPYEYTFTEPTFLSATTTIPGADLTIVTPPLAGCTVSSVTITDPDSSIPNISEGYSGTCNNVLTTSADVPGPFDQDGVYSNGAQDPTILTITGTPAAAVPEPGSVVLLLSLIAMVVVLSRRNSKSGGGTYAAQGLPPNSGLWKTVD